MTLADRLITIAKQLQVLEETTRADATPDDLEAFANHLRTLGEHGRAIEVIIDRLIDDAGPGHPVRAIDTGGTDVQVYLGHAGNLFQAAQSFASDARVLLGQMNAAPA